MLGGVEMEMNQYLDMFIEESKENLQAINKHLLVLESEPTNINVVQEIFRSAHTLKGMSATMGFEDLASLTHELENVLDLVRNAKFTLDSDSMDVIFRAVDKLEEMLHSIETEGDGTADVSAEIANLKRIGRGEKPVSNKSLSEATTDIMAEGTQVVDAQYFDNYQTTVLLQSITSGFLIYKIEVELSEKALLKAARAFMVFTSLESMGEVIKTVPSIEEIEEEKFDNSFEVVFVTRKEASEIQKNLLNISEIEAVSLFSISEESLKGSEQVAATVAMPQQPVIKENAPSLERNDKAQTVQKKAGSSKTIRVDIERLEALMNLFSELVIDRGRLEQIAVDLHHSGLSEVVEHMNRISGDLQNIILNIRMVPVEQVFNRFPRMVRDLAKDLNKKINLTITGADTELDRTVIDEIGDPLVHLLRNAVDHGLETTEERRRNRKLETGEIELKAYHSGNHVFIEVKDDGGGIEREAVLRKAIQSGLVTEANAAQMTDHQVYQLLFASGFSTAKVISDVSGRGVGLDVVRNKIESLGGKVSVDSQIGIGTTFSIQLPLTLSIISSMLVQVEGEKFAIPLSSIIETAAFKPSEIMLAHKQQVIDFRGKVVPLVHLKQIFKIPTADVQHDDEVSVVIVRKGDKMAGLVVDSFIGQQEIVLKSLGKYLTNVFAVSGATILGDGQVALIIDPNALII